MLCTASRWNYWLAGGLHPRGFHLTNVLLHAAVSVLSLAIFNLLLGGASHRAALLASLLFAVHPIHAEAVSIIFIAIKWWLHNTTKGSYSFANLTCLYCSMLDHSV
jgi:hypothetical protein